MGYNTIAVFAEGKTNFTKKAIKKWKGMIAKKITEPFNGFGIAFSNIQQSQSQEEWESIMEIAGDLEDNFPEFSKEYPELTFVYIEADCAGGTCLYEGYVCKNGKIITKEEGDEALKKLVEHLGVRLSSGKDYFKPFERGFFNK